MFYAQLNEFNIVVGVSDLHSAVNDSHMININLFDESIIGKQWNGIEFVTVPDTNTYLDISLPANPLTVNTNFTVSATVKNTTGAFVPVTSTYYVPVIRTSDNKQAAFLVIDFVNGQASVELSLSEPGIYTIQIDKIYPLPTSILESNITIIAV